ncbi:MAG: hypothetical protein JRE14_10915 [Deltaproteobacteria bacterium]|nr:hypothetical protein [Deltaproteobacteria bacterium]
MLAAFKAVELGGVNRNNINEAMFKVEIEEAAGGPYKIGVNGRATGKAMYVNSLDEKGNWVPIKGYKVEGAKVTSFDMQK